MKSPPRLFYGWIIVAVSFGVMFIIGGGRGAFGVFVRPWEGEFGWSRTDIALAASISALAYGLGQPLAGYLIDRFGPRRVISLGVVVFGIANLLLSRIGSLWQLYIVFGVVMALSFGACTIAAHSFLLVRWFRRQRGVAIGAAVSGMAAGGVIIIPVIALLLNWLDWRQVYLLLGGIVLGLILPLAFLLIRNSPQEKGLHPDGEVLSQGATSLAPPLPGVSLSQAVATLPFWLMSASYFTCGFTVFFITTHFIPAIEELGFSRTTAANVFSLLNAFSVIGVWVTGPLSDRVGRKNPLAFHFFLRAVGFILFLFPMNLPLLYLAAVLIGFSFLATAPLTTSLVADIYGTPRAATIYGIVAIGHQVGGALGAFMAGVMRDTTGSYYWAFPPAIFLLLGASLVSFKIKEAKIAATPAPAGK